jgi:hypothetical protein
MSDERKLTLYKIADARGDLDALCKEIEVLKMQLARLPSRAYVSCTVLMATGSIWALFGLVVVLWLR